MPRPNTYKTLTNEKKLEILQKLEETGNISQVAGTFGVSRKSIRDWRNNKPSLELNVANGRKYGHHCSFKVEINTYPEKEILLAA